LQSGAREALDLRQSTVPSSPHETRKPRVAADEAIRAVLAPGKAVMSPINDAEPTTCGLPRHLALLVNAA